MLAIQLHWSRLNKIWKLALNTKRNSFYITHCYSSFFRTMSTKDIIFSGPKSTCTPLQNSLGHLILNCLNTNKDDIFQIDPESDTLQTRGEIRSNSIRVAIELERLGLKKGDVITLCTRNQVNTVLPFLGAIYLGATVNIVHEMFNKNELTRILLLVKPKMILCDEQHQKRFETIVNETKLNSIIKICDNDEFKQFFLSPSDNENQFRAVDVDVHNTNALILCSSGTTGLMKGIPHTHHTFYHAVCDTSFVLDKNDRFLTLSPLVWNSSSWIILFSIIYGTIRIAANWIDTRNVLELVEKYKVTYINLNPSKVHALLSHVDLNEFDQIKKLRVIWSRGSANTKDQMQYYRTKLPNTHVMNAIGCTEMAMMLSFFDPHKEFHLNKIKINSVGKLCPGVKAKIVQVGTDKSLGPNQNGELYLKAECMAPGYYNNPEANKSAFTEDGWYRSGDLAYFDDDECLYIEGRLKEILKYNTIWINPVEVEEIINEHPGVLKSCVMGVPDPIAGDLPIAFIVKKSYCNLTEQDIIKHVEDNCSDHQRLRGGVQFIDDLPMTPTGKIRRTELQKLIPKPCHCFK